MAAGLKFRIKEVEGLYYPCSENKGADQLRGYREADLRLCFRICNKPVFSRRGLYKTRDIICIYSYNTGIKITQSVRYLEPHNVTCVSFSQDQYDS